AWTVTRVGLYVILSSGGVRFQRAFRRRAFKRDIFILPIEVLRVVVCVCDGYGYRDLYPFVY
ncbi:hypothetical protein ACQWF7_24960, partial [Salmonella enterica subsp. enterica serovar Infantis]